MADATHNSPVSPIKHYVNGTFLPPGPDEHGFPLVDSVTGRIRGIVPEASRETVDAAVQAARAAVQAAKTADPEDRAALLRRIAAGIQARFDEFGGAEVGESGKPREPGGTRELPRA